MRRVHVSGVALLLAVSASAWAGEGELNPADVGNPPASSKTRAQVIAELHAAQRLGLMTTVEANYPGVQAGNEAAVVSDPGVLRARVRAEAREAGRLGLLNNSGDGNRLVATAAQEELIAAAGQRAADEALSAQRVVRAARK